MSGYRDTDMGWGGQMLSTAEDAEIQRRLFEEEAERRRRAELARHKLPEISLQPTWEASGTEPDLESLPWPGQPQPGTRGVVPEWLRDPDDDATAATAATAATRGGTAGVPVVRPGDLPAQLPGMPQQQGVASGPGGGPGQAAQQALVPNAAPVAGPTSPGQGPVVPQVADAPQAPALPPGPGEVSASGSGPAVAAGTGGGADDGSDLKSNFKFDLGFASTPGSSSGYGPGFDFSSGVPVPQPVRVPWRSLPEDPAGEASTSAAAGAPAPAAAAGGTSAGLPAAGVEPGQAELRKPLAPAAATASATETSGSPLKEEPRQAAATPGGGAPAKAGAQEIKPNYNDSAAAAARRLGLPPPPKVQSTAAVPMDLWPEYQAWEKFQRPPYDQNYSPPPSLAGHYRLPTDYDVLGLKNLPGNAWQLLDPVAKVSPRQAVVEDLARGRAPAEVAAQIQKRLRMLDEVATRYLPLAERWERTGLAEGQAAEAVALLKSAAVEQMMDRWEQNTGLSREVLAATLDGRSPTLPPNLQASLDAELQAILTEPAFQLKRERIYSAKVMAGGQELADYTARPGGDGRHMEVYLTTPDGHTHLTGVPKVTHADVGAEVERVKAELNTRVANIKAAEAEASRLKLRLQAMDKASPKGRSIRGEGRQRVITHGEMTAAEQKVKQLEQEAEALQARMVSLAVDGTRLLLNERVMEEVKKPQWRGIIGEYGGITEVGKGAASGIMSMGSLFAHVIGDEEMQRELAAAMAELDTAFGGSSRRRLEGGWWNNVVLQAQQGLGEELIMAPVDMATSGGSRVIRRAGKEVVEHAVRKSVGKQIAKGLARDAAQNAVTGYGSNLLNTDVQILQAEEAGDMDLANRLRQGKHLHALLSLGAETAVGKLKVKLPGKRFNGVVNEGGQSAVNSTVEGTLVSPMAYGGEAHVDSGSVSQGTVADVFSSTVMGGWRRTRSGPVRPASGPLPFSYGVKHQDTSPVPPSPVMTEGAAGIPAAQAAPGALPEATPSAVAQTAPDPAAQAAPGALPEAAPNSATPIGQAAPAGPAGGGEPGVKDSTLGEGGTPVDAASAAPALAAGAVPGSSTPLAPVAAQAPTAAPGPVGSPGKLPPDSALPPPRKEQQAEAESMVKNDVLHHPTPTRPQAPAPPLWSGPAPRGEPVEVLDRNPDGTWQVRLNEAEMTVKEPHMAAMTRQLKPAVDALTDSNDLRVDDEPAAAPGLPLAQTSHATPTRLHKLADRATRMLQRIAPDMFRHGQVLHRGQDLLEDADYIRQRGRDFTPEERAAILSDEGFYDPLARRSFVFAGQVRPQQGESPRAAVNRVFLHETVGHGGLAQLLATNEKALRNFKYLVEKIRKNVPEVYDSVAQDPAYAHLEGDPVKIGIEIMGRETERRPELLQRPSVFRDMRLLVGHALAQLQIQLGLRAENAADIDRQVDMLLGRARRAADREQQVSVAHITGEGLLYKRGDDVSAAGKEAGRGVSQPRGVGHSFTSIREKAALERLLAQFGGPDGVLMKQVQRIAANRRRFGPEVAEGILQSLVSAMQEPHMRTARARDVVLKPLQNSAQLSECILGLATAVKSGLAPAEVADVLTNHARILSPHYTSETLLLDTEILGPIPGLSDLWRMLKTDSAQAKGFRYELEGAAAINRGAMGDDVEVTALSKRISVSLNGLDTKTDIDVVVRKDQDTVIYSQLKRSAKALGYGERGLEATKLWVAKALLGLAKHKSHKVVYVVPPGIRVPPRIEAWLKSVQIDIVRIHHAD